VQAEACEIEPKEYMNPILMKPSVGYKTQVITRGKVYCNMDAYAYKELNQYLKTVAKDAFDDIAKDYEVIVLEGSGSCAEINLRETDIANMKTAEMADAPVILVADIDKGGVFASIVGTIMLLTDDERARVKGIIINKFRGKKEYFEDAMKQIEELTQIPVLGVLPYFDLDIEDEDGATENITNTRGTGVDIAVIRLPHMSNFTDFNSLSRIDDVTVRFVKNPRDLEGCHMVIIPGSKNTIEDLRYLKQSGFADAINFEVSQKKLIFGICGGYQMLGTRVEDPLGVEGDPSVEVGLGLLDIVTSFKSQKTTKQTCGIDHKGNSIAGYEIHNGESVTTSVNNIWIKDEAGDVLGMKNSDDTVYGTYLHGLFDEGEFGLNLVNEIKTKLNIQTDAVCSYQDYKMQQYDKLCDLLKENINMDYVEEIMNLK
ncbi:MAG: cobyric acid synthase, partial [Turicibacter sp.]